MTRIVSLIPSATEIVGALGFADDLVGRSHECDHPAGVERLPALTEPKFAIDGSSYDIDERVKAILSEGLSVYRVDAEHLRALAPDVIITQSQCEVCAVSLTDVERAVCEWIDSRPRIVSLEPRSLADVWRDMLAVAAALGVPGRGVDLLAWLDLRMGVIENATRAIEPRPTVAVIEWIDPLMAAGNWMPELIDRAGGTNLFGEVGEHSPWMQLEDLTRSDPDWILVIPCGFDLARTRSEMATLDARPEWRALRAVREGRVVLGDGHQFFNRPGPRLVESLEILVEALHPGVFRFGHEGVGWERWSGGRP
jgi:iron complex transport system substrate-binding protein